MSTINNTIIGAAEREFEKQKGVGNQNLDKMAFLKLLVAQLQHQDPLNPMEDTEFVSQLAQFTSLETLNNINGNMENVLDSMTRQESVGAANFLGKMVESYGDQLSITQDGKITELYYYLNEDIVGGQVNIMSGETGEIIRTIVLPATAAGGPYPVKWDGLDYKGEAAPAGVYPVGMSGVTKEGSAAMIASQVSGKVDRVFFEDGVQYLGLEDGRVINLAYVTALRELTAEEKNPTPTPGDDDKKKDPVDDKKTPPKDDTTPGTGGTGGTGGDDKTPGTGDGTTGP